MREKTHMPKKSLRKQLAPWAAYLWMAPTITLVLLFVMMPVINTFIMAFNEVSRAGFLKGWNNFENFTYIFKQLTGLTFMEYLHSHRIHMAKRLLEERKKNFTQIGERCGFTSLTYFGRVFKRYTGLTLSEYVRQIENGEKK